MTESQVGCKLGNKMLDKLVDCKHEYEKPCCYGNDCCEGNDCDCCNEDGNKPMGYCECMLTQDEYGRYLENQEKVKHLDRIFRKHQKNCENCQLG